MKKESALTWFFNNKNRIIGRIEEDKMNERTSLEHFFKQPARPVKEVLKDIFVSYVQVSDRWQEILLAINTDAKVNKEQEEYVRSVFKSVVSTPNRTEAWSIIAMLNSFRG